MNCVYQAFQDHLKFLNEPEYYGVQTIYFEGKKATKDENELTFAGVVPWLYMMMLNTHNRISENNIAMQIQRQWVTMPEYMKEATPYQRGAMLAMKSNHYGPLVNKITFAPAIYCMLNEQHALFSETIPDWKGARILMAIQLTL